MGYIQGLTIELCYSLSWIFHWVYLKMTIQKWEGICGNKQKLPKSTKTLFQNRSIFCFNSRYWFTEIGLCLFLPQFSIRKNFGSRHLTNQSLDSHFHQGEHFFPKAFTFHFCFLISTIELWKNRFYFTDTEQFPTIVNDPACERLEVLKAKGSYVT